MLICTECTGTQTPVKTSWIFGSRNYLRRGWEFIERTRSLSGIQFVRHFIEFVVVETKRFVGSFVNAILTCQTCGQHSIRVAV